MQQLLKTKPGTALLFSISILLLSLVYLNHFNNSFHFDDSHTIVNNLSIRDMKNLPSFFKDGTTFSSLPSNQSYRPVVTTLNAWDYFLSGRSGEELPEPLFYHISIFLFYVASGLLLYSILVHILNVSGHEKYDRVISFFCTLWFWFHTANAETVNYVIARSDSFSTFMVLFAFALYLNAPSARKYYLYLLPVVVGFLTKEPAILFIPLLFLYKLFFEQDLSIVGSFRYLRKSTAVLVQMAVPIAVALLLFLFYSRMTPDTWTPGGVDPTWYRLTQPYVILHYFKNFLLPIHLVVDTDWTTVASIDDPRVYRGLFFLLLLTVIIFYTASRKQTRPITFGLLWFLMTLAPTSLIAFAEVMNDHRTFFPYIGLFITFATLLSILAKRFPALLDTGYKRNIIATFGILFLGLHAYGVYERNEVWNTEESLWKEATIKAPNNGRAWMNYGLSQMATGQFDTAEACFNRTISLWPNYSYGYINMGVLQSARGKMDLAEQNFKIAMAKGANSPECYTYYADFLLKMNRLDEAGKLVAAGLALSPNHNTLRNLKKKLKERAGQTEASFVAQSADAYLQMSLEFYNAGRYEQCIEAAQRAIALRPGYDLAYNNICAAYNQLKQWDKAIHFGEEGRRLNPDNALIKGNLDVAYRRGK